MVGCGFVGGGAHVPALSSIGGAKLVAVADADKSRLDKVARKYDVKSVYQDYADLVKDPAVDAVVVAVPTPMHLRVSMAAIKAGKHVLCEMPLAPSLGETVELIAAARKQNVYLMPGLTFRFTPNYVKAKELIDSRMIGEPLAIMYREFIPASDLAKQWPAGSWAWDVEISGGPLYTLSGFSIDLVRWLLGEEVIEVHAATKYTVLKKFGGTLGYDAFATIRFAGGVVGSLQYSGTVTNSALTSLLEVTGDSTRSLVASGNDSVVLRGENPAKTEWRLVEPSARAWGHQQEDEYFVRCILEGREPEVSAEDGLKAMEIALKIAKST